MNFTNTSFLTQFSYAMRTIIWLNTETVIENEIDRLTKKLKTAKKKKNKSAIKRIEKEISRLNKILNDLE